METLRHSLDAKPLIQWGRPYDAYKDTDGEPDPAPGGQVQLQVLSVVSYPICPRCQKFSYFCSPEGDFSKPAATLWRQSVIGFVPQKKGADRAGTATIMCPICNIAFGFHLASGVIEAYRADCRAWPKEETVESANTSATFKRTVDLLRATAPFDHANLSDAAFLAAYDEWEARTRSVA